MERQPHRRGHSTEPGHRDWHPYCRDGSVFHFVGAIIDAEGHEIPIIEAIIQRACRVLDKPQPGKRRPA
ncbi:PA1571 family protein [Metapseudomonas furukawaii]|uniref:PA1571 family protein n=1 Tax=Metapseudomonas furukawaii TaxID=1149133 RepID=UPI003AF01509